jgi:AraC family transcriptional regulator, regulatory protein of adaptative response / methylated-DNA-[protein]-cysteine methyltransferase
MIFVSSRRATKASVANAQSLDPEAAWRQLVARDRNAQFVYAVTTTGVYCRPGCASRRPLRRNVRFFRSPAEAGAAGFRPCLRCRPTATAAAAWGGVLDHVRAYIEMHLDRRVSLAELGRVAGLSPFTVQRLFKRQMGASPLAYQRALRAGRLRRALKQADSVTDAVYDAGFSSASRAYEGAPLGMTPARFAQGGRGERIAFASAVSPFGWMVAGATARGLCWLSLASTRAQAENSLRVEFPQAELRRDPSLARWIEAAVEAVAGRKPADDSAVIQSSGAGQPLDLRGTAFQLRVWQALRQIPRGQTRSYSQLARELGDPMATRAVARACAANRVALLVPCHRVVGADGALTGYRWGVERKQKLLASEKARSGP